MKRLFYPSQILSFCIVLLATGSSIYFSGCKKEKKDLTIKSQGFLTCKVHYAQHFYGTDTSNTLMAGAGASFIDANGNTIPAGTVSVNDVTMENTDVLGQYNYGLSNQDETFFSNASNWSVSGSDQLKGFGQNAGALIPFRMTLPYTMLKANGISFTVDIPSTFSYSEVRVTIGDKDDNRVYESFDNGNISFPASAFNNLSTVDGNSYIMVEVLRKQTMEINKQEVNFTHSVIEQHPLDIQ